MFAWFGSLFSPATLEPVLMFRLRATAKAWRNLGTRPSFPTPTARSWRMNWAPSLRAEEEGLTLLSSLGKSAKRVFAQNDRATQYSGDASDRTEKPRRTGSPAFAGDDSLCHSADRQRAARGRQIIDATFSRPMMRASARTSRF